MNCLRSEDRINNLKSAGYEKNEKFWSDFMHAHS